MQTGDLFKVSFNRVYVLRKTPTRYTCTHVAHVPLIPWRTTKQEVKDLWHIWAIRFAKDVRERTSAFPEADRSPHFKVMSSVFNSYYAMHQGSPAWAREGTPREWIPSCLREGPPGSVFTIGSGRGPPVSGSPLHSGRDPKAADILLAQGRDPQGADPLLAQGGDPQAPDICLGQGEDPQGVDPLLAQGGDPREQIPYWLRGRDSREWISS